MTTIRRLRKELQDLQESDLSTFRFLSVDDDNLLHWSLLILPNEPPYNKGAFVVEIEFPKEYPFQPPKIIFKTKIYHPNINEKGQVCLNIINPEQWKPSTRIDQVINSLITLVNRPEPDHPLRADLGEEFQLNYKKFIKNAEEFTKKFSELRPN